MQWPDALGLGLFSATGTQLALAQDAPTYNNGDVAWMLVSTMVVIVMTIPGLALFYGGLVRKKNVLGVMMQCVFLMGLMTILWATYGYSLAFGGDGKYIGNDEFIHATAHEKPVVQISRLADEHWTKLFVGARYNRAEGELANFGISINAWLYSETPVSSPSPRST